MSRFSGWKYWKLDRAEWPRWARGRPCTVWVYAYALGRSPKPSKTEVSKHLNALNRKSFNPRPKPTSPRSSFACSPFRVQEKQSTRHNQDLWQLGKGFRDDRSLTGGVFVLSRAVARRSSSWTCRGQSIPRAPKNTESIDLEV